MYIIISILLLLFISFLWANWSLQRELSKGKKEKKTSVSLGMSREGEEIILFERKD